MLSTNILCSSFMPMLLGRLWQRACQWSQLEQRSELRVGHGARPMHDEEQPRKEYRRSISTIDHERHTHHLEIFTIVLFADGSSNTAQCTA